ncbi:MAG: translation initiation factor [Bacteroidales bacterium]|nr:translation initiation factor [Bacteroidales bacterium]
MANNDWKSRLGVVFSTNPDFNYSTDEQEEEIELLPPGKQKLIVTIDRKKRAGKQVTLVSGFIGPQDALEELCKKLKTKCGTGGSAKEGEILIQGDMRDKVVDFLVNAGYNAKRGN